MTVILLDYGSVLIFALTGALAASRAQLDAIGFAFIACLTALGGGTLRDILLDRPVFWIENPRVGGSIPPLGTTYHNNINGLNLTY